MADSDDETKPQEKKRCGVATPRRTLFSTDTVDGRYRTTRPRSHVLRRDMRRLWVSAVVLSVAGCGSSASGKDATSSGGAGITAGSGGEDGALSIGASAGDDGELLDVANDDGGGTTGGDGDDGAGCESVDFLFVIDNSGSMGDNQQNLVDSFPGFIQAIQSTVAEASDYHIMVAKTDSGWGGDCPLLCQAFFGICPDIPEYPCMTGAPSMCDTVMGAGVTYPIGSDSSGELCSLAGQDRYITPADPDLGASFGCIAKVGTDGSGDERPVEALTGALSDTLNGAGGCNAGFLRDEAILVVTIITDEEDSSSAGSPQGWVTNVIAQKGGDGTGIVMIGLINDPDATDSVCGADAEDPARLREFIESFPNSYRGSVCAPNYADVLADAVGIIDTACDEYVPPAG